MTAPEFGSFVLAFLVALILFFGGQRALIELTDNEDFALPVQVAVDQPDSAQLPSAPVVPPEDLTVPQEDIPGPSGGSEDNPGPSGGSEDIPGPSGKPESESP